MKKLLLAATLATSALGGLLMVQPLAAQDKPRGGGMARADTDGDGSISRAEFIAQSAARFARLDTNGDGKISADEMTGPGARMLTRADTNGDGSISREEFDAASGVRFTRMDTNGDGKISPDEMQAMAGRMRGRAGGMGGQDVADVMYPPPPGGPDAMGAPPPPGAGPHMGHHGMGHMGGMMMADTNKDGRISRDEMRAQADARFAKMDTNGDGYIDKAEMDAVKTKMKQHMGRMRHGQGMPDDAMPKPDAGQ